MFEHGQKVIVARPGVDRYYGYVIRQEKDWVYEDKREPQFLILNSLGAEQTVLAKWLSIAQAYPEEVIYINYSGKCKKLLPQTARRILLSDKKRAETGAALEALELDWYYKRNVQGDERKFWLAVPKGTAFEYILVEDEM